MRTAHRLRTPRAVHPHEEGITLVELLVTMTLMGIVGSLIFAGVLGLTRTAAVADRVTFDQGFGRNALSLISRDVRAAARVQQSSDPAFVHAGPDSAEFTANLRTGEESTLIHIEVDASRKIVVTATEPEPGSEAPDLVFDPADEAERYIASYVVNTDPIFQYFAADGTPLDAFDGTGNLSESDRRRIASVEITLDLNRAPIQTDSTRLTTTVRLPNAGATT